MEEHSNIGSSMSSNVARSVNGTNIDVPWRPFDGP
jgi:hypothetical protein